MRATVDVSRVRPGARARRCERRAGLPTPQFANFAFASELGSGIYEIGGSIIQVYQLPRATCCAPPKRPRDKPGLRLIFPSTVGFFNFTTQRPGSSGHSQEHRRAQHRAGYPGRLLAGRGLARLPVRQGGRDLRLLLRSERADLRPRRAQRLPLQHLRRRGPVRAELLHAGVHYRRRDTLPNDCLHASAQRRRAATRVR